MDVKWKSAIYFDSYGNRKEITVHDIQDDKGFTFAKNKKDFLDTSEIFDLKVRERLTPNGLRHFYEPNNSSNLFLTREDEEHDLFIERFLKKICLEKDNRTETKKLLFTNNTIEFNQWDFSSEQRKKPLPVIDARQYLWNTEVVNQITERTYTRNDIVGIPLELGFTKNRPKIIIEVIKHHFISSEVLKYFINLTEVDSVIVLFLFVKHEKLFNNSKVNERNFEQTISCHIQNGRFFYCGIEIFELGLKEFPDSNPNTIYHTTIFELIIKKIMTNTIDIPSIKKTFLQY